jgi:hypothetical protein
MRKLLVLVTVLASGLAAAAAAGAASGGATVIDNSGCWSNVFVTTCYEIRTVTNSTTTPSGVRSYMTNGTVEFRSHATANPAHTWSRTTELHDHSLRKDGELHQESQRLVETTAFDSGGGFAQTCVLTLTFQYANGEVRLGESSFDCTTP